MGERERDIKAWVQARTPVGSMVRQQKTRTRGVDREVSIIIGIFIGINNRLGVVPSVRGRRTCDLHSHSGPVSPRTS